MDAECGSQSQAISGFAELGAPDLILREEDLEHDLPDLAQRVGQSYSPMFSVAVDAGPYGLADIHDDTLEKAIASIYQRDYLIFGFGPWQGGNR